MTGLSATGYPGYQDTHRRPDYQDTHRRPLERLSKNGNALLTNNKILLIIDITFADPGAEMHTILDRDTAAVRGTAVIPLAQPVRAAH